MSNTEKKIKIATVNSVEEFIEKINKLDSQIIEKSKEYLMLFRGQSNADWSLSPGISRPRYNVGDVIEVEKRLLAEFKRRAIPYLPPNFNINSDWEWLALAQHFKLPTRLLDWSENPLVALYFAFKAESTGNESRAVWTYVSLPDAIAEVNTSPFAQPTTKIFKPNQITQRITVQSGWFTAHSYGDSGFVAIDQIVSKHPMLAKFVFPDANRKEILIQLDRLGINDYSIFPDLDGLSTYLEWKYFRRIGT